MKAAIAEIRLRLAFIAPIVFLGVHRDRQRARHLDEDRTVGTAIFEEQHAGAAILGQSVSEHASRRARPDDDIVETFAAFRHHRINTAPQVKPPPIASIITRSPFLIRPSREATSRASGIEAAEVLPCNSTVFTTFSGARPSLSAEASMIRRLA